MRVDRLFDPQRQLKDGAQLKVGVVMDARAKITAWRDEYIGERPHSSPGYRTPKEFAGI